MMETFGSLAGIALGQPQPAASYRVIDFRSDTDLLAQWGAVYRCHFRWQRSWGDCFEVLSAKHPTAADANAQARQMALASGYLPPRWWEFWRRGEEPLP